MRNTSETSDPSSRRRFPALAALGTGTAMLLSTLAAPAALADNETVDPEYLAALAAECEELAELDEDASPEELAETIERCEEDSDDEPDAEAEEPEAEETQPTEEELDPQEGEAPAEEEDPVAEDEPEQSVEDEADSPEADSVVEEDSAPVEEESAADTELVADEPVIDEDEDPVDDEQEQAEVLEEETAAEDEAAVEDEDESEAAEEETEEAPEVSLFSSHEGDDDDESIDPTFHISPDSLDQRSMEQGGVTAFGYDFEAETEAVISLDGAVLGEEITDEWGDFAFSFNGQYEPGTYEVEAAVGAETVVAEFDVEEGGYSPSVCVGNTTDCYFDRPAVISQWDLAREGLEVRIFGFAANSTVDITVDGTPAGTIEMDESGAAPEGIFTMELEPGEYTFTASSSVGSDSDTFTVIDDDEDWEDFGNEPYSNPSKEVLTESEIAADGMEFYVSDYPYDVLVDVRINGEYVETVHHPYFFRYQVQGDYPVGELVVEFVHPTATLTNVLHVVSDEQGEPPHQGSYPGTSVQTHSGSVESSEPHTEREFSFDIDEDGNITGLNGEFFWSCVGPEGYIDSGTSDLANSDIPTTPLTIDQPFDLQWEGPSFDYSLTGIVNSDGSASGTLFAGLGACGYSQLSWSTDIDGGIPEPTPEPTEEPEPSPEPTEDPEPSPEPTEEPSPEPTTSPEPTQDPTTSPSPTEEPSPTTSPEPTEEPSPEPTEEPTTSPSPTEEPTTSPSPTEDPSPTTSPEPTEDPTSTPTSEPTTEPTVDPTEEPTAEPTQEPTSSPAPTDDPSEEPTSTPTSEPTSDPTSDPSDDPTAEPSEEPGAFVPSAEDLTDGLEGGISAPASAAPGEQISVSVENAEDGAEVTAWLFSDPADLGGHTVEDGSISVIIPEDTTPGEHQLAVADEDSVIGWDSITITGVDADPAPSPDPESTEESADTGSGSGSDPADTDADADADAGAGATPEDGGDDDTTAAGEATDKGDATSGAAESGSATSAGSSSESSASGGLAQTGTTVALVAAGALLLMLLGLAALTISRRRAGRTVK